MEEGNGSKVRDLELEMTLSDLSLILGNLRLLQSDRNYPQIVKKQCNTMSDTRRENRCICSKEKF